MTELTPMQRLRQALYEKLTAELEMERLTKRISAARGQFDHELAEYCKSKGSADGCGEVAVTIGNCETYLVTRRESEDRIVTIEVRPIMS